MQIQNNGPTRSIQETLPWPREPNRFASTTSAFPLKISPMSPFRPTSCTPPTGKEPGGWERPKARIGPGVIVQIRTDAYKSRDTPEYSDIHPGMSTEAAARLIQEGVGNRQPSIRRPGTVGGAALTANSGGGYTLSRSRFMRGPGQLRQAPCREQAGMRRPTVRNVSLSSLNRKFREG